MTIRSRAEDTARAIFEVLQSQPSAEQSNEAVRIIEETILGAYQDAAERCRSVADTFDPDAKRGESLVEDIRVLIANLSSMR